MTTTRCDRCGKEMTGDDAYRFACFTDKKYDLCRGCEETAFGKFREWLGEGKGYAEKNSSSFILHKRSWIGHDGIFEC